MLLPTSKEAQVIATAPTAAGEQTSFDFEGLQHAIVEARQGLEEGGVPIGAALVSDSDQLSFGHCVDGIPDDALCARSQITSDGRVLGTGRNRRVQMDSAIRHGETDCLENIGRLPASVYRKCTMFTTLSPCTMCTGAIILYGIPRVVMGENSTFVGGEDILRDRGVEVVNLDNEECKELMSKFIKEKPDIWNEDIGE